MTDISKLLNNISCRNLHLRRESTSGVTALGPGLLVSLGIARQMARSKVIVCTDGQANRGLGNLDDATAAYAFYTEVAEIAKESGYAIIMPIYLR